MCKVVGRKKDQINRGGEKIAAEEIENVLLQHGAVVHAALIPCQLSDGREKLRLHCHERRCTKADRLAKAPPQPGNCGIQAPRSF